MTKDKRKLDRVKALHRRYDRDQKWNRVMQAAQDRVGEVRHLFEAVGDSEAPNVSPQILEQALDYLMGTSEEKPSRIPTKKEFFGQ